MYNLKRFDEAEKEYRKAIKLDPNDANTHNNLGHTLRNLDRYDEAEKEFREAIRITYPDDAEAHYNLGCSLQKLKRHNIEAEKEYREAIRLNPNDTTAHTSLKLLEGMTHPYSEDACKNFGLMFGDKSAKV